MKLTWRRRGAAAAEISLLNIRSVRSIQLCMLDTGVRHMYVNFQAQPRVSFHVANATVEQAPITIIKLGRSVASVRLASHNDARNGRNAKC